MKVLITSGGCKVPIDDVRYITNFSSGRYGAEICNEFTNAGHETIFFYEKGSKKAEYLALKGDGAVFPKYVEYKTYYDYLNVKELIKFEQPDVIISAAAISDYVVDKTEGKISSDNDELVIKLKKGEKVIKSFKELAPNAIIVGFKLLVSPTDEEKWKAIQKVQNSGAALVVYNDLTELRKGNSERILITPRDMEVKIPNASFLRKYIEEFVKGYNLE